MAPTTSVSSDLRRGATNHGRPAVRVHVIQTGRNEGNETFMRANAWSSNLRRRKPLAFPVLCYVVEHPDGLIAIDTGSNARVRVSRLQYRLMSLPPLPLTEREDEIDYQLRAKGLRSEHVRLVVLTHLDWDHAGGIGHFPNAEILVHRPEHEYATTKLMGKLRYQTKLWPSWFDPTIYELDPEPYGPFPESKALTRSGDVRLVPIPGHTIGQVGVVVETDGGALLFSADHVLRQDWFVADYAAGNLRGLAWFPKLATETSRRIQRFAEQTPTVLLPSHDAEAPDRLAGMDTLTFGSLSGGREEG